LHGVQESDKTSPRVSIHLHGSNTEPKSDGYPTDTFTPGQTYDYNFNNNQEAATLWYHDHALGITGQNVMVGLAGVYLLRDIDDPIGGNGPLGIPAGAPYEIPLVLQDRILKADGLIYHPAMWEPEFLGDVATVNGKAWPNLDVERTVYRFRIVNGSSARTYNLKLVSNPQIPIIQIGTDGGFLNAPVQLTKLLLSPGERADVLIDFSNRLPGEKIVLQNEAVSPFPFGRSNLFLNYPKLPEIMQFTVKASAANPKPIPQTLRLHKPVIEPIATPPVRQRFLTLVEVMNPPGGPPGPAAVLLNFVYWDEAENYPDLMERPKVDTVEQWNIINLQPVAHPMHLHLVLFQILNRQKIDTAQYTKAYLATGSRTVRTHHEPLGGPTVPANYPPPDPTPFLIGSARPPAPNERGWKDTVLVNPGEVTRLIVPFGAQAAPNLPFGNSFTGRYVWHCHMIEHEDNEMMLPFEVVP
jgi:FtsP/CotA-like multicopper oxidase with cupredoxin domain